MLLISLTGTLLVWKEDYLRLTLPEARVAFTPTPAALAQIGVRAEAAFASEDILNIAFPTSALPLAKVTMYPDKYAYLDSQGEIIDVWQGNGRPEEWLYDLHHRLLLEDTGLLIVGFGAMAMVILLLAGMLAWWPMRRGFRLGFVPRSTERAQLRKSHRNLGIVLALPFLLTLVSGITLVFPQDVEELLLEDIRTTQEYSDQMVEQLDGITGAGSGDWLPALERSLAVFPGAAIRSAQVPSDFSYYRIIGLQQTDEWSPLGMSRVYIDSEAGYMDIRIDNQALPTIERAYNALYPLHTGRMETLWYKLFLSLSGLGVATLSVLGLISFVQRFVAQAPA